MGVGIVGPGGRFRVVLHCENWKCFVPKAFHRSVVQVHVGDFEIGGAGDSLRSAIHRKSVILRGNEHPPGGQFSNGVISAPVPVGHFAGGPPESQTQELMTQADPENRHATFDQSAHGFDGIGQACRVTRSIR